MKKTIVFAVAALLASFSNLSAQETNNAALSGEQINAQFNELGEKIGETIETGVKAFGAALGTMVDGFTKMFTMAKVCSEEDKNANNITLPLAEEIIKTIAPQHITSFKIDTMQKTQPDFAIGEFSEENVDFKVELSKSYCLVWLEEMASPMSEMPDKMQKAVKNVIPEPTGEQKSATADNSTDKTGGSYIIAGDDVDMNKFTKITLNGWEIQTAYDEENQNAYAFGIISTLGIRVKVHGNNAQEILRQFCKKIDAAKLLQIMGGQSVEEIKSMLNQKYQEALQNIPQGNPFDTMLVQDGSAVSLPKGTAAVDGEPLEATKQ